MDWLTAILLPDVSLALLGIDDGSLLIAVKVIDLDGKILMFTCPIPLEDVKDVLQGGLDAARK